MANQTTTRRAIGPAGLALGALLAAIGGSAGTASGQEANLSEAATQPARGRVTWREQFVYNRYETDAGDVDRFTLNTRLTLGLTGSLSAVADVPLVSERERFGGGENTSGLGDVRLGLKWRFWQHDTGAIETNRLALTGGLRLPTGAEGLSSEGFDPFVGLVFTKVQGRHGVNAAVRYQYAADGVSDPIEAGKGTADWLAVETSYLYRLSPSAYTAETEGSLYGVIESFVDYETNGDAAWRLAPGLLWEARRWAAEGSLILPAASDVDHRGEQEFGFALGVRVLF
jgi:hypothetical protein